MGALIYGTQARSYGIKGNVATHDGVNTVWASLNSETSCFITGYTFANNPGGQVTGFSQLGFPTSEAVAYAQFDVSIQFEFGSSTLTPSIADADSLLMPEVMASIRLQNFANSDMNGNYNYLNGSMTGNNQGWKVGSMTLRSFSNGTDLAAANKAAFSAIT